MLISAHWILVITDVFLTISFHICAKVDVAFSLLSCLNHRCASWGLNACTMTSGTLCLSCSNFVWLLRLSLARLNQRKGVKISWRRPNRTLSWLRPSLASTNADERPEFGRRSYLPLEWGPVYGPTLPLEAEHPNVVIGDINTNNPVFRWEHHNLLYCLFVWSTMLPWSWEGYPGPPIIIYL